MDGCMSARVGRSECSAYRLPLLRFVIVCCEETRSTIPISLNRMLDQFAVCYQLRVCAADSHGVIQYIRRRCGGEESECSISS
jgi:hypothetical protein